MVTLQKINVVWRRIIIVWQTAGSKLCLPLFLRKARFQLPYFLFSKAPQYKYNWYNWSASNRPDLYSRYSLINLSMIAHVRVRKMICFARETCKQMLGCCSRGPNYPPILQDFTNCISQLAETDEFISTNISSTKFCTDWCNFQHSAVHFRSWWELHYFGVSPTCRTSDGIRMSIVSRNGLGALMRPSPPLVPLVP
jgi:hypothetical protein